MFSDMGTMFCRLLFSTAFCMTVMAEDFTNLKDDNFSVPKNLPTKGQNFRPPDTLE